MITKESLSEFIEVDVHTGLVRWLKPTSNKSHNQSFEWQKGARTEEGYRVIVFKRHKLLVHRIVFLFATGKWPTEVDHINGNRQDNRLCNLRDVTRSINAKNQKRRSTATLVSQGVDKHKGKYRARIRANGYEKHIGYFDTECEASLAYEAAKIKYGYHENHGR